MPLTYTEAVAVVFHDQSKRIARPMWGGRFVTGNGKHLCDAGGQSWTATSSDLDAADWYVV
jgi:hypothetical protein